MSFNFQIDSQVKVYATSGAFPATGVIRTIYIDKSSDTAYYWDDATSTYKSLGGGSASIVWGSITGTLADQTDLQNALNTKVDKVTGKGLSTNDYTTAEKNKLADIQAGAEVNVNADWNATSGDAEILNKPTIPSVTNLVPYTGATSDVNIGEYQIKAGQVELDQTPTGTIGVAKIRWNDTDGTIDVGLKGGNVTLQVGLEELVRVVNKSGAALAESAYQAVRVRLVSEGGAAGQRLAVVLAQANNDLNSATTIGIVTETIANNAEGFINRGGEVRGINTTGSLQGETWVDGDILYLSPTTPGALTNIKPTAPDHSITIGYVVYSHAVNGKIFVKVDNGYELEELHNVTSTDYTTPSDADALLILQDSESLWKRLTWANVKARLKTYFDTLYQTVLVSGTNIKTIEGQSLLGSGNIDITASNVGLGNVDNTSDLNKPISTATQTALDAKQDNLISGTNIKTINGSSVLGSGNLTIGSSGLQGAHNLLGNQISTSFGIMPCLNAGSLTNFSITAGNLYLVPFIPNKTITSASLKINVVIAGVGAIARILVYSDLNAFPRSVLYQSSNLDCSTTGIKSATTAFTFTAGTTYWLAVQVGASNITLNGITTSALVPIFNFGFANPYVGYYTSGLTIGTPPNPYSLYAYYNTAAPAIFISLS